MESGYKMLFDNIYYLIKKQNKKIGDVEKYIGVSSGYISRTYKEGGKPSIEFIINIASVLNTSIDFLLGFDMSHMDETELYLLEFFDKLYKDTASNKLEWVTEKPSTLNNMEVEVGGWVKHPLYKIVTLKTPKGHVTTDIVYFPSHSFGSNNRIVGNCHSVDIDNETKVYLMAVGEKESEDEKENKAIEVWLSSVDDEQFVCSDYENSDSYSKDIAIMIDMLYSSVEEYSKKLKINDTAKNAIDSFLNNR